MAKVKYTYHRYGCWWEDATSHCVWKDIKEAEVDAPAMCYTEGYLLIKNDKYHTFLMSFAEDQVGEQMIIPTASIKKLVKVGTKKFFVQDFIYDKGKNKTTKRTSKKNI